MNEQLSMTYRTQVLNEQGQILTDCKHAFDANTYFETFKMLYADFPTFTIRQYAEHKGQMYMRETRIARIDGISKHGFIKVNEPIAE